MNNTGNWCWSKCECGELVLCEHNMLDTSMEMNACSGIGGICNLGDAFSNPHRIDHWSTVCPFWFPNRREGYYVNSEVGVG